MRASTGNEGEGEGKEKKENLSPTTVHALILAMNFILQSWFVGHVAATASWH
jgi:hypothetical protein